MHALLVISGTVMGWAIVLGASFFVQNLPRAAFLFLLYVLYIGVFGFLAFVLRQTGMRYAAWVMAVLIALILLSLELFYFVFVNPAEAARFLTVADWLIPAFLVWVSVYLTALFVHSEN